MMKTTKTAESTDEKEAWKELVSVFIENHQFDMNTIADALEDEYDLKYFEPQPEDPFNAKDFEAIDVVTTEDVLLAGKVKEVIYGGFKECDTGRVFMKSKVIVYKNLS